MLDEGRVAELARRLTGVGGVQAVLLGGSRARGDHTPESDVDLGVYYRGPLDVDALGGLARELGGDDAQVTSPGAWGPWVDGGAWLHVDGTAVDWIYRDWTASPPAGATRRRGAKASPPRPGTRPGGGASPTPGRSPWPSGSRIPPAG